jgi:hypothetical protein
MLMTTPHESRAAKTSTRTGKLISAICAIYSEWRASCSRVRCNKRARTSSRLPRFRPERRECFAVSGVCRSEYHLLSRVTQVPRIRKAAVDEAARNRGLGAGSGNETITFRGLRARQRGHRQSLLTPNAD